MKKVLSLSLSLFLCRKTSWIPGPAPLIKIHTNLELVSMTVKQHAINYTFNVTGNLFMCSKNYQSVECEGSNCLRVAIFLSFTALF